MLVLTEPIFRTNNWYLRTVSSLKAEARKKRINLTFSTELSSLSTSSEGKAVIFVGAGEHWMRRAVVEAKKQGKHPVVLANLPADIFGSGVSSVSFDFCYSMRALFSDLSARGRGRAALYAVNPSSVTDLSRKDAFLSAEGQTSDLFYNRGSLHTCFEDFFRVHQSSPYGSVVCCNDFAAISLIKNLRTRGVDPASLSIVSYGDTILANCFSRYISSVVLNHTGGSQLAFVIADCIEKNETINSMTIKTGWEILHRQSIDDTLPLPLPAEEPPADRDHEFYSDPELQSMMCVENLLLACDETDLAILKLIMEGKKRSEIEEACFLTETAVKYRIRKMKEICSVDSREELRTFLTPYISDPESLMRLYP